MAQPSQSKSSRCPARFIIRLCVLIVGLSLASSVHAVKAQLTRQVAKGNAPQGITDETLAAGQIVTAKLGLEESHSYRIALARGQLFRAQIKEHGGVDTLITLFGSGGQKLHQVGGPNSHLVQGDPLSTSGALGIERLSFIAEIGGVYHLEVRAKDAAVPGWYELKIEELRTATEVDQKRVAAERAFATGEQLRARVNDGESLHRALGQYEQSRALWRALADTDGEADALNSIGIVFFVLQEKNQARDYFEHALQLWRATGGNVQAEANSLLNIGISLFPDERALDYYQQSLQTWRSAGDRMWEALMLSRIARFYLGHLEEAQKCHDYFEQSLGVWQTVEDNKAGEAITLFYYAFFYARIGERQKARDWYQRTYEFASALGHCWMEVDALLRIGETYYDEGEYQTALDYYEQALARCSGSAYALHNLGTASFALNEKEKALDYFNDALPRWQKNRNGEAYTLERIGNICDSSGETREARDYYNRALPLMRATGDRSGESHILNDIGLTYSAAGEVTTAFEYFRQGLQCSREYTDRKGEALSLTNLGALYGATGDWQRAGDSYERARQIYNAIKDRSGEANIHYELARLANVRGLHQEARAQIEAAMNIVESLRAKITGEELRAAYFASVQKYYELYVDLLMREHERHPAEGLSVAAFEVNERGRARNLRALLAAARVEIHDGVDPALRERERTLLQTFKAKAQWQTALLNSSHTESQVKTVSRELEMIEAELDRVQARIRATSPRYAALAQPSPPPRLREIQENVLDANTLLLEYALGDERSFLWAVTPTTINSYELPRRAELEVMARRVYELLNMRRHRNADETVAQWRARLSATEKEYAIEASRLSRVLLGPLASSLKTKRLLIVSDGALQYVPFAALPEPADASGADIRPLIVAHEIINLPSASTLLTLRNETANRQPAPKTVAVLADPVFDRHDPRVKVRYDQARTMTDNRSSLSDDLVRAMRDVGDGGGRGTLSRLPFTRDEAAAITAATPVGNAMIHLDFGANLTTAQSAALSQYRIIHFATHGLLDTARPSLSGLVFSLVDERGQPQDGFLRLREIYNLHLPAELVVLSACQSGLGKEVRGEGLVGLTRGFMYAGAKRVVASLWKVEDEDTADLMKRFYEKMLNEHLSPASALRAAQIEMWQKKRWRGTQGWAAFVLQGEYL